MMQSGMRRELSDPVKNGVPAKLQASVSTEVRNKIMNLAQAMVTAFASGAGGFTLRPITATELGRIKKYAVGVAGYERRFRGKPTLHNCLAYLEEIASTLFDPLFHLFLGGWEKSAAESVCDLVEIFDDFDEALAFADSNGQEAFTFLHTLEEFSVEIEKRRKERAYLRSSVAVK